MRVAVFFFFSFCCRLRPVSIIQIIEKKEARRWGLWRWVLRSTIQLVTSIKMWTFRVPAVHIQLRGPYLKLKKPSLFLPLWSFSETLKQFQSEDWKAEWRLWFLELVLVVTLSYAPDDLTERNTRFTVALRAPPLYHCPAIGWINSHMLVKGGYCSSDVRVVSWSRTQTDALLRNVMSFLIGYCINIKQWIVIKVQN